MLRRNKLYTCDFWVQGADFFICAFICEIKSCLDPFSYDRDSFLDELENSLILVYPAY